MKKILIKMLPMVATVLLATSCGKDDNNDNNIVIDPVETQNVASPTESKTIPFSITVVSDSQSLSKATVQDETSLVQVFEKGDVLEVKFGADVVGTLSLQEGDEGKHSGATFSTNEFKIDGLASDETQLSVTLKNELNGNNGELITEVKSDATTLTEAFKKYGRWTSTFTYTEGSTPSITLKQNTAFIEIRLPQSRTGTISIKKDGTALTDWDSKTINEGYTFLAVPSGVTVTSSLFDGEKSISVEPVEGKAKIVYTIDRIATAHFVDLGLQSGALWAKCNIGASNPWEYGNYYAWGEIETKSVYATDWSNYQFGSENNFTKYTGSDGKNVLDPADDIAYLTYGGGYSMPNNDDWKELVDECYWVWTPKYGNSSVAGYIVYKAKESEHAGKFKYGEGGDDFTSSYSLSDIHIFLPGAGRYDADYFVNEERGNYWSSMFLIDTPTHACEMWFSSSLIRYNSNNPRYCGCTVRAIRRK